MLKIALTTLLTVLNGIGQADICNNESIQDDINFAIMDKYTRPVESRWDEYYIDMQLLRCVQVSDTKAYLKVVIYEELEESSDYSFYVDIKDDKVDVSLAPM